jgi:hypothetical protein
MTRLDALCAALLTLTALYLLHLFIPALAAPVPEYWP